MIQVAQEVLEQDLILTACHCLGYNTSIHLKNSHITLANDDIKFSVAHPHCKRERGAHTHDLALIKLKKKVKFISPIPLVTKDALAFSKLASSLEGKFSYVGFGETYLRPDITYGTSGQQDNQKNSISLSEERICHFNVLTEQKVSNHSFATSFGLNCAHSYGDSGGPAIWWKNEKNPVLFGIMRSGEHNLKYPDISKSENELLGENELCWINQFLQNPSEKYCLKNSTGGDYQARNVDSIQEQIFQTISVQKDTFFKTNLNSYSVAIVKNSKNLFLKLYEKIDKNVGKTRKQGEDSKKTL